MKYLELKKQIGSGQCSISFWTSDNLENANKAYQCYEDPKHVDIKKEFKITDLKKFNIIHLRFAALTEERVQKKQFYEKNNGFSAKELKKAGFSAKDFKNYDTNIASKYPNEALKLEFTAQELYESGFSARELKDAGFDAQKLRDFPAKELRDLGFSAIQLKNAGIWASSLKSLFTNEQLKEAGFSALDLKDFVSNEDLVKLGYGVMDLIPVLLSQKRFLGFEGGIGLKEPLLKLFNLDKLKNAEVELRKKSEFNSLKFQ